MRSPDSRDLEASAVVAGGRYRLEALVGSGGMGSVWKATVIETGETVALKFLKHDGTVDESAKRRMRREAKAAMAVKHPNVVQILEVIAAEDEPPIIVMQFLVGETLQARLAKSGPLDMEAFAEIFVPVLSAVGTAHAAGVVHRDLKPENIWLVTTDGGVPSPRVLDFGIAKLLGPDTTDSSGGGTLTTTGGVLGTPRYMAPEQVFGAKDVDHRADVWSLGVVAYECLSGERPIRGDNVWQVLHAITTGDIVPLDEVADVPAAIGAMVMRMLSVDRNKRPDDLVELFEMLRPLSQVDAPAFPHTPTVHTEGHLLKTAKKRERRTIFFAATTAVLLGMAAVIGRLPKAHEDLPTGDAAMSIPSVASAPASVSSEPALHDVVLVTSAAPVSSAIPKITVHRVPSASVSAPPVAPPQPTTPDPFHGLAVDAPF